MLIKLGVDISRLNRPIRRTLTPVENIFLKYDDEGVITSTYEGNHMPSSLHYNNDAYDIGRPEKHTVLIVQEIKDRLGRHFDVVLESDHVHIEYDPK